MTLMKSMSEHSRNVRAGVRVGCAASLGLVVGGVVSLFTSWQAAILIGWDAAALFLDRLDLGGGAGIGRRRDQVPCRS